jgi:sugar O-acyltransferase (sialic acid O-acetyltransferase NeuD family)
VSSELRFLSEMTGDMGGVLIIGAGGHGKVIADIFLCQGVSVMGFLDDDPTTWGTTQLNLPVLGGIDSLPDYDPDGIVLGIGSNEARRTLAEMWDSRVKSLWCSAIHPRATIAASVRMGHGVVVAAGAVINPDSVLGDHVIINTGSTVDHDCTIGDYAHIAPGVSLAGGVSIGQGALMGLGSTIIPDRSVGNWSVVGAGAVVVRDIPDRVLAKGVPAHWETEFIQDLATYTSHDESPPDFRRE